MRFNREKLEESVLLKIREVNEESGYRPYLEVPEMVELVARSIEEMLEPNPHDGSTLDDFLLKELNNKIESLEYRIEQLEIK